jgi:low affinity Fe/Cu permease
MTKRKGNSLVEVFAAEQEIACKELEKIKGIITRSDRAKELVLIEEADADEIRDICDWVQEHLRGRRQRLATLVRNEPPTMEGAIWGERDF